MSRRKSTPKKVTDEVSTFVDDYDETGTNQTAYKEGSKVTTTSENIEHDIDIHGATYLTKDGENTNFTKDAEAKGDAESFGGSLQDDTESYAKDLKSYKREIEDFLAKDGRDTNTDFRREIVDFAKDVTVRTGSESFIKNVTERFATETGCYDKGQFRQNDLLVGRVENWDGVGIGPDGRPYPGNGGMGLDDLSLQMGFAKYKMYGTELERVSGGSALEKSLAVASGSSTPPGGQNGGMSNVHTCPYCDKQFPYKCHLQTHIRTHTGEKPFSCDHCGKNYANRSKLKRHMRSHTGERPYKCVHCGKCFSRSDNLTTHIVRTHQGLRVYSCEMCTMSFTTLSHLQRHEKTHTGYRPYPCLLCEKKFSRQDNLETHMARVHNTGTESQGTGPQPPIDVDEDSTSKDTGIVPTPERGDKTPDIKEEPVDYTSKDSASKNMPTSSKRKRACPRKIADNQLLIDVDEESDSSEWDVGDSVDEVSQSVQEFGDDVTNNQPHDPSQINQAADLTQAPPGEQNQSQERALNLQTSEHLEGLGETGVGLGRQRYRSLIPDAMKKTLSPGFRGMLGPRMIGGLPVGNIANATVMSNIARRKRGRPPMEEYSLDTGQARMNPELDALRYEIMDEDGLNSTRVKVETMEMRAAVDVHICKYCGQPFGSQQNLIEHLKTHSENVHKCPLCFEELCTQAELQQHMKLHAGLPFIPSSVYQMLTANMAKMAQEQKHLERNALLFNCNVCNVSFKSPEALAQHSAEHKLEKVVEKSFPCHICNAAFTKEEECRNHFVMFHVSADLACKHCTAIFQRKQDLTEHVQKKHRLHVCHYCGKKFGMLNKLQRHLRRHTGERPFKCVHCDKCFSRSDNLQTHIMRMHGVISEPVRCDMCDKKFNSAESLQEHYRIHTGEKPFPCPRCEKAFMWVSGLKKHMQTHADEVPYSCRMCSERFDSYEELSKHMMTVHIRDPAAQEGAMSCKICSEKFETNDDLAHHMMSVHVRADKFRYTGTSPGGEDQEDDSSEDSMDSTYEGRPLASEEPMDLTYEGQGQLNQDSQDSFIMDQAKTVPGHDLICNFCTVHCDSLPKLLLHCDLLHKDQPKEELWGSVLFAAKTLNGVSNGNKGVRRSINFNPKNDGAKEDLKMVIGRDFGNWAIHDKNEKLEDQLHTADDVKNKLNGDKLAGHDDLDLKASPDSGKSVTSVLDSADLHCSLCNVDFENLAQLSEHMEKHILRTSFKTNDCQYTCRHCLRPFKDSAKFRAHLKWHARWKQSCDICGCKFDSRSKMERHLRVHTGERPFSCVYCEKRFTRTENLKMHVMRLHDVPEPLICKFCGNMYKEMDAYTNHCQNEHMEDEMMLDSSEFSGASLIVTDSETLPTMVKPEALGMKPAVMVEIKEEEDIGYKCEVCEASFPSMTTLAKHVGCDHPEVTESKGLVNTDNSNHSNGSSLIMANDTDTMTDMKAYLNKAGLTGPGKQTNQFRKNNMKEKLSNLSNGNKPKEIFNHKKENNLPWKSEMKLERQGKYLNSAEEASPSTSRDDPEDSSEADALSIDVNFDQGLDLSGKVDTKFPMDADPEKVMQRPFPCSFCDKRFTTKSHLVIHVRTHTGEKPYRCLYCDMQFRTSSKLGRHLKTHTGETPHKCKYCDRQFGRKDNLKAHLNRAHANLEGNPEVKCEKCDKAFASEYALKQHMRMHLDKKFACDICDQSFTWNCHLLKHVKTNHPDTLADGNNVTPEVQ